MRAVMFVAMAGLVGGLVLLGPGPLAAQDAPRGKGAAGRSGGERAEGGPLMVQGKPLATWLDALGDASPARRLGAVRALSSVNRKGAGDVWPALRAQIDAMASDETDRGARIAAVAVAELLRVNTPEARQEAIARARRAILPQTLFRLADRDGRPVAGALVGIFFERDRDRSSSFAPHPAIESRSTDDRGEAALALEGDDQLDGEAVYAIREGPGDARPLVGMRKVTRSELGKPVTITMFPACRVRLRAECPTLREVAARFNAEASDSGLWTAAYVRLGEDDRAPRPLFSISRTGELEFLLPPGRCSLYVYGSEMDPVDRPIEIAEGQRVRSLGVVELTPNQSLQQGVFRGFHHEFPPGPRDAAENARVVLRPVRAVGIKGSPSGVLGVAYSPDGATLATAHWYEETDLGGVKLRDAKTGELTASLPVPAETGGVLALAFSPDGTRLAGAVGELDSAKPPGVVAVWDVGTCKVLHTLRGHSARITTLAFSLDGKTLASGGEDKTVRLWDLAEGRESGQVEPDVGWVRSLAYSPDGRGLLIGGVGLRLWDVPGHCLRATLEYDRFQVYGVAFSPDGRTAAAAGGVTNPGGAVWEGQVRLYDLTRVPPNRRAELSFEAAGPLQANRQGMPFSDVAFTPDGRRVVGVMMMTVVTWDAATRDLRDYFDRMFGASDDRVAISPRGGWMAVSSRRGTAMYDISPRVRP